MKRRRQVERQSSYLMSMLDLLSGAFACSAVIFVIFATLMGADLMSERAFMHVEARLLTVSGEPAHDLFQVAIRVDPELRDGSGLDMEMSSNYPAFEGADEGADPFGLRVAQPIPKAAEDMLLDRGPAALPMIAGRSVAPDGAPTDQHTASLLLRGSGVFIVGLSVLPRERMLRDRLNDQPPESRLRLELVVHHTGIDGGMRVVHRGLDVTAQQLDEMIRVAGNEFAKSGGVSVRAAKAQLVTSGLPQQIALSTSPTLLQSVVEVR